MFIECSQSFILDEDALFIIVWNSLKETMPSLFPSPSAIMAFIKSSVDSLLFENMLLSSSTEMVLSLSLSNLLKAAFKYWSELSCSYSMLATMNSVYPMKPQLSVSIFLNNSWTSRSEITLP